MIVVFHEKCVDSYHLLSGLHFIHLVLVKMCCIEYVLESISRHQTLILPRSDALAKAKRNTGRDRKGWKSNDVIKCKIKENDDIDGVHSELYALDVFRNFAPFFLDGITSAPYFCHCSCSNEFLWLACLGMLSTWHTSHFLKYSHMVMRKYVCFGLET